MTGKAGDKVRGLSDTIIQYYGPYAFGVAALLIIWFSIVAPELRSNRIDFAKNSELVYQMKEISDTMHRTAQAMERTVARLDTMGDGG